MSEAGEQRPSGGSRRRRRWRGGSTAGRSPQASQGRTGGQGGQRGAPSGSRGGARSGGNRARPPRETGSGAPPGGSGSRSASKARDQRNARPAPVHAGKAREPSAAPSAASNGAARLGVHELADARNEARRRANRRRRRALALGAAAPPAIVLGVVIGVVGGPVGGVVTAVVILLALAFGVSAGSMGFVLRLVGGTAVHEGALPALANQVEGLCGTLGVAQPELRLVDDPVANACALAGRRGRAVLVVTSGLLDRLGLIEMEGVVAHELVHVKRGDASVSSLAVATAGVVAWVTGNDSLVHLAVGRGREFGADQAAALAVRYPPGLRDALASMGGRPSGRDSPFTGRRWAATRWVWIDPMVGATDRAPLGELDATAVRIDALAEW
jgi:heat shock protein HtpX